MITDFFADRDRPGRALQEPTDEARPDWIRDARREPPRVCTAKEVDPDRRVDQDHWASFRIGRRRETTSTSGIFPWSAANRRRAASSTRAFRPSRTATDFEGAPVTRTASSRRSGSISSVVLMHRESHKSYARSTGIPSRVTADTEALRTQGRRAVQRAVRQQVEKGISKALGRMLGQH